VSKCLPLPLFAKKPTSVGPHYYPYPKEKTITKLVSATLPLLPTLPSFCPLGSIDSLCKDVSSATRLGGKNLHLTPY